MARKKSTKQKQKQKQSVRQSVSQKVVVQVGHGGAPRRRRAPRRKTDGGGDSGYAPIPQQPIIQQPPPQPPAFMDASALEMNARLGLFGDQLQALSSQEEARNRQAQRHMDEVGLLTNLAKKMLLRNPPPLPPIPVPTETTKVVPDVSVIPPMFLDREKENRPKIDIPLTPNTPIYPHERTFAKHAEAEKAMNVASGSFGNPFGNFIDVLSRYNPAEVLLRSKSPSSLINMFPPQGYIPEEEYQNYLSSNLPNDLSDIDRRVSKLSILPNELSDIDREAMMTLEKQINDRSRKERKNRHKRQTN